MAVRQKRSYYKLVEDFEEVARANLEKLKHVNGICRLAQANERTLSRAYRVVRGTSPYKYLQELRLKEVKRILSSETSTVTQAAFRFGFRELGRFAVQYKKTFGESPSETLRRARSLRAP